MSRWVYTAAALIAISAAAFFFTSRAQSPALAPERLAALEALKAGDMKKLTFHSAPQPVGSAGYITQDGSKTTLAGQKGKLTLLNFWATWCAPCRKEMPALSTLQSELGSDKFEVLTIATGRNDPAAMARFFKELGVTNLPLHTDPTSALAREMGVLGLPATILISPDGTEIARLLGDADWAGDEAKALLAALLAPPQ